MKKYTRESDVDQTGVLEFGDHQYSITEDNSNQINITNSSSQTDDTLKLPKS